MDMIPTRELCFCLIEDIRKLILITKDIDNTTEKAKMNDLHQELENSLDNVKDKIQKINIILLE